MIGFPPAPPPPYPYAQSSGFLSLPVGASSATLAQLVAQQGALYNGLSGQSLGAVQGSSSQAQYLALQQAQLARLLAAQQAVLTGGTGGTFIGAEPEPVKDTGIRAGEITGWRAWLVNPHGFLTSLSAKRVWAPHEPMDTETLQGDLGIHSFKTLSRLLEFVATFTSLQAVLGQVELWGDVIEHEIGYRSEHAAIISLEHVVNGPKEILRELRKTYAVPWVAHSSVDPVNTELPT